MPIGIIANVLSVVVGGIAGAMFGKIIKPELRDRLYLVFGISSMGLGIPSIMLMKSMAAVVTALILGTILGTTIHLGALIEKGGRAMARLFPSGGESDASLLVTAVVLFCTSGTGMYGSMISGMNGDHTILLAKSVLDLFTAMMFAVSLGYVTALIGVPQTVIFMTLFFSAKLIYPLTTEEMICDFKACGGLLMLATGFRIAKIKDFPIADMVPGLILVMPISYAWTAWILPLLG